MCVGGWWRKSRLICYVFKGRAQEEFYASNGETCALYCGDGRGQRGGDGKCPDTDATREIAEKLDG